MSDRIKISVSSEFDRQRMAANQLQYIFKYRVQIDNLGDEAVQLLRRYWIIDDGNGQRQEVEGEGVVGEQPIIAAGQSYEYNSFAVLPSPTATMSGHYLMQPTNGRSFQAPIEAFVLAQPLALH
ncbi:Co2+/Mg2+ efflux protein ApaG [Salinibius halmophilus]|uniref:Co2+/Mg2+ efflux protein ApaG n=1 Tax=Salinibius halmophilus TaxID=1853216 RepID=UPI000E66DCF9|nr:Co2+/Mg2+ efflux protein ApaG [Salinibius halmophilus]